ATLLIWAGRDGTPILLLQFIQELLTVAPVERFVKAVLPEVQEGMSVLDIPAHLDGEHVVTRTPVIGEAGALQLRHGSSFRRPRGSHRRGRETPPMPASRPTTEVVGLFLFCDPPYRISPRTGREWRTTRRSRTCRPCR